MNRLFRHIAAFALSGIILIGCAYDDTVRQLKQQADGEGLAIAFSNGIIDNPVRIRTRAQALSLLSDHTSSMGVWGWQTTPAGDVERLFLNQNVTFSTPQAKWTYNPVKYWDYRSIYRFSAYAPHSSSVTGVTATIDSVTHAISIKGVTLQGSNTIDSGVPAPPANFSLVADVDWMLDRNGQSMSGILRDEVMFNMQHILSKLSIRVCRAANSEPDSVLKITVDSLMIGGFVAQGDFTQSMTDDPVSMAAEWTPVDTLPRYSIMSARNVSVPDSAVYILESLLIPQSVRPAQSIRIWYSIGNGHTSHMDHIYGLGNLFGRFETGKSYVITITIGPEPIRFNAGVQDWSNREAYRQWRIND